jgi:hypothetical protein
MHIHAKSPTKLIIICSEKAFSIKLAVKSNYLTESRSGQLWVLDIERAIQ